MPSSVCISRVCPRCARACPVTVGQTSLPDVKFAKTAGISSSYTASCRMPSPCSAAPGMPSLCSCMPGYGDTDILVGCHIRENRRYLILLYRILPDALVGLHIPGMPSLRSCMPGYGDTDILVGCHICENSGL